MDNLAVIARLVIAAVFVIAGFGKLMDVRGAGQAMKDFGVPARLAGSAAVVLPSVELVLAGLLLVSSWAKGAAWGALGLLALFSAVIAGNLLRGRKPPCRCFGQIHSRPVGVATLVRNGQLGALAALVAWHGPGPSIPSAIAEAGANESVGRLLLVMVLLAVAVQAWLLTGLLRQQGRLLLRIDGLEARIASTSGQMVGAPAPSFELPAADGGTVALSSLLHEANPAMLIFSDPDCGPCGDLVPAIAEWQHMHADRLPLAVVTRDMKRARDLVTEHGLSSVLVQQDREVAVAYGVVATPSAILVGPDGSIASAPAAGTDAIHDLVRSALQNGAPPARVPPGHDLLSEGSSNGR